MTPSRVVAEVNLKALVRNLEALVKVAALQANEMRGAVAMVKANAYGHGLEGAALALEKSRLALALGVAALEEGIELRTAGVRKPIWVFSGSGFSSSEAGAIMQRHGLTPMIHTLADLREIVKPKHRALVRSHGFHLKINTGMNRLGIDMNELGEAKRLLEKAKVRPQGLCTHFASAESPASAVTRAQVKAFKEVIKEFASFDCSYIHSANSAATLNSSVLGTSSFCNVIRPGLALYGYTGPTKAGVTDWVINGQKKALLRPVLKLKARVISFRFLEPGSVVGYGATCLIKKRVPQAVLAIGYGDGLSRQLSNGSLVLGSRAARHDARVLGRVSMDLLSVELAARSGQWVTLLGEDEEQGLRMAECAGVIIYEILTSISARVPRVYL